MKYTMQDYIEQSYEVCVDNIKNYDALTRSLVELYNSNKSGIIWLVASGSSYNACISALPFMRLCINSDIRVITPFTFVYGTHEYKNSDFVIVVTQSGMSTNAIEAIKLLKQKNMPAICLTGNIESDVKNVADVVIDYGVGEEVVGYVTKGVTTLCLFLMLFAVNVSQKIFYLGEIKTAIDVFKTTMDRSYNFIEKYFKEFSAMSCCYCCGFGNSYGVALEAGLKIGETIHIPSIAYEVEEYIHGPNLQLTPGYTVLFFDSNDGASERVAQIYRATKRVTDHTFMVSSNKDLENDAKVLYIPNSFMPECSSLVELPFVQLVSYIVSSRLNSFKQHPLLKEFKEIVSAKTASFINYDEDE